MFYFSGAFTEDFQVEIFSGGMYPQFIPGQCRTEVMFNKCIQLWEE